MHRDRLVKGWSDNDWRLMGEGRLLLEQRTFDPGGGRRADDADARGDRRRARVAHVDASASTRATELVAMVERAGFVEIKCWGGFEHEPFTPTSRLVIVATNIRLRTSDDRGGEVPA